MIKTICTNTTAYKRLTAGQRHLHFTTDLNSETLQIKVHDTNHKFLYKITPSQALRIASGESRENLKRRTTAYAALASKISDSQSAEWPREALLSTFSDSKAHFIRCAEMSIPSSSSTNSRSSTNTSSTRMPLTSS